MPQDASLSCSLPGGLSFPVSITSASGHILRPPTTTTTFPPAVSSVELFVCGSPHKSNIPPSHAELESMCFHAEQKRRPNKKKKKQEERQVEVDHKFTVNVRFMHNSSKQWK